MNYRIEKLGPLLQDASRKIWSRFEQRTASYGLSAAQWRLLGHLLREGPSTQTALAALLEVEPISVSRLIDRMEQGGWLHREAHPDDRRARIVVATDKARRIGPEAKAIVNALYDEALAGLSDDDRCVLQAALVKISENLKAPDPSKESEALPTPFETQT
ncbi:MarR family transcriptional regulator [Tabrizicola sp.]|uniref:MarR family winged helix-turn-helix transcriptional regulator n=1 Tax=Tabrizicola sp. TaxID=2005166 RepID=UPI001A3D019E|nr:MarR family transcriptional regulator [Tabrizicola sp.]MBL9075601.1 MarR family transcriptional regulator [Tabrizicola sp.]